MGTKRFQRVAVIKGGPSAEREVSLNSGAAVARGLRAAGYDVTEIDLQGRAVDVPAGTEAAFIALHGEFGEDGQIQALFDRMGVPYTGSGAVASRRAFDKTMSKMVFTRSGIATPAYEVLRQGEPRTLPLPVVIKPACQGSSIGVGLVFSEVEWYAKAAEAFKHGNDAIVETYIPGRELTVGIVGDEALPVIEIEAPDGDYNYKAKYTKGVTRYLAPAPLEPAQAAACRELALQTYRALGCRGMGRVDLRLQDGDGAMLVLELNSIPGFTETSLLPKAAGAAGIGFPELCARILELAACG